MTIKNYKRGIRFYHDKTENDKLYDAFVCYSHKGEHIIVFIAKNSGYSTEQKGNNSTLTVDGVSTLY